MMKETFLILFFAAVNISFAQTYKLQITVKNLPFNKVVVGELKGDKFVFSDSLETRNILTAKGPVKTVSWNFPPKSQPGMYRIIFGQTTYARVMDEPPQQLDFLFNGEDIRFETDFKAPADSLIVLDSEENIVWFSFLKEEKKLRETLKELETEVNYCQNKLTDKASNPDKSEMDGWEGKSAEVANSLNQLQMQREAFILETVRRNENLFATRLIKTYREPYRDGYLNQAERNASYQKEYFRYIDFADEFLVYTPVLTDKIFNYLVTYNHPNLNAGQREKEYIKAVEYIMQAVTKEAGQGSSVYEFVLAYLVDGFERLNMTKVLEWISEKYTVHVCETEGKTTLKRKLEAQKMIIGSVVPDFTINDLTGNPVTFSKVLKDRNLLVFWASWCPHCHDFLPGIKSLCSGKREFEVIGISLDKSIDEWQKAVSDTGFDSFINLSDLKEWDGPVAENYNIYATPTLFLVDENRKILAKPTSLAELSKALGSF